MAKAFENQFKIFIKYFFLDEKKIQMLYKLVFQKLEMWEVLNKTEKEKKIRKGGRKGDKMVTIIGKITATVPSFFLLLLFLFLVGG